MAEPKIRFTRDDGSSYPELITGKLRDITDKVDRKAPAGSVAPIMMVSQGNGFIYQADKYSRENAGQSLKNYTLLKQGEFAYNHGASKAKPYGVAYCLKEEQEARVPFVYHTFSIIKGINSYWHEALNTSKMDRKLKRMVSSGARMDGLLNINYDTYMDVDVSIPCEEEQQKIADFLSSVDEVISTSEKEVAYLVMQKKALMQKIFTQGIRFKKDNGTDFHEWKHCLLGDIFVERNEQSVITEEYPLLSFTIEEGVIDPKDKKTNKRDYLMKDKDTKKFKKTELEDIIYNPSNMKFGAIHRNKLRKGLVSPIYAIFQSNIDPVFMEYVVSNPDFVKRSQKLLEGTVVKLRTLKPEAFLNMEISIPSDNNEQSLIAGFLSDFDEAITAAKKELELWKQLKKGLLQQMFV